MTDDVRSKSDPPGERPEPSDEAERDRLEIPAEPDDGASEVERILRKSGVPSFFPAAPGEDLESTLEALRPADLEAPAAAEPAAGDEPGQQPLVRPSLIPEHDPDPGATAARRGLPRRARPGEQPTLAGTDAAAEQARAALLTELGERTRGAGAAELYCGAAELWERLGDPQRAATLYARARESDPGDLVALRELRKLAIQSGDWKQASELLAAEAALSVAPREQALCHLSRAELLQARLGDAPAALEALQSAREADAELELPCALLTAELQLRQGRTQAAADAFERAAAACPAPALREALLREAAAMHERAGEADARARTLLREGHGASASPELELERYRATVAAGDRRAAMASLQALEDLQDAELTPHLRRARAALLARDDAKAASDALRGDDAPASLRLRAMLTLAGGDAVEIQDALQRWAQVASGQQRALALLELGWAHARAGDGEQARRRLDEARAAAPGLSLLEPAEDEAARVAGARPSLLPPEPGADGGATRPLEEAARLSGQGDGAALDELERLTRAPEGHPTATTLAIDAAIEAGRLEVARRAMRATAERAPRARRAGALLATSLLEPSPHPQSSPQLDTQPDASRRADALPSDTPLACIAAIEADDDRGPASGERWLALSTQLGPDFGGFAATHAASLLSAEGRARECLELALVASPGYGPACWALEELLSADLDRDALHRVHRALARSGVDPVDDAARLLRAARAVALRSPQDAESLLRTARGLNPGDRTLTLGPGRDAGDGVDWEALETAAGGEGPAADVAALRAAAHHEDRSRPARAAALYREVLDRSDGQQPHAELGLERTLEQSGLHALLGARREQLAAELEDESARAQVLEQLAWEHEAAGEQSRAEAGWRALREAAPYSVPALRALQRSAMARQDRELLGEVSGALADVTRDPRERAAQTRVAMRAGEMRAYDGEGLDLWHALRVERRARRSGDDDGVLRAGWAVAEHLASPAERASWILRCASITEERAPTETLEALRRAAGASPSHPLVHEPLSRMAQARGDHAEAARALEASALAAAFPERGVRMWHRAGVAWQQRVGDVGRAREAFSRAAQIDITYRDLFDRLRRILDDAGEARELLKLVDARLERGAGPELESELQTERARALLRLGERQQAKAALTRALSLREEAPHALRTLADLQLADGQHREAAESLILLARCAAEPALVRGAFLDLGQLYETQLPDLRRAEIAYTRALGIEPNDAHAIDRLIEIYLERGSRERALRAAARLVELSPGDDTRDRAITRLAGVLHRLGETTRAGQLLEERRAARPLSPTLIAAMADQYEDQLDHAALVVHLDRSSHALREALLHAPLDGQHWATLVDVLTRRERPVAANAAAAIARELGVSLDATGAAAAPRRLGPGALDPAVVAKLWTPGLTQTARALIEWWGGHGDLVLPHGDEGDALDAQADARVQEALGLCASWLGGEPPRLRILADRQCTPLSEQPLTVGVGEALLRGCDAGELAFLIASAVATVRTGLWTAAAADPQDLTALARAVAATAAQDPSATDAGSDDDPRLKAAAARVARLSARHLRRLQTLTFEALAGSQTDAGALPRLAHGMGARLTLVASGALRTGLGALGKADGVSVADSDDDLTWIEQSPRARELLEFALSDTCLDLRPRR
jgi:predicted Zn-dependent protease